MKMDKIADIIARLSQNNSQIAKPKYNNVTNPHVLQVSFLKLMIQILLGLHKM